MLKNFISKISQTLSIKQVPFGECYERFPTFIFMLQYLSCLAFTTRWCIDDFLFIFVHGNVIMCELVFFSLRFFISFLNTFVRKTNILPVVLFGGHVLRKTVSINHENRRVITGTPNISNHFIRYETFTTSMHFIVDIECLPKWP